MLKLLLKLKKFKKVFLIMLFLGTYSLFLSLWFFLQKNDLGSGLYAITFGLYFLLLSLSYIRKDKENKLTSFYISFYSQLYGAFCFGSVSIIAFFIYQEYYYAIMFSIVAVAFILHTIVMKKKGEKWFNKLLCIETKDE